jgi:hypothetical protein
VTAKARITKRLVDQTVIRNREQFVWDARQRTFCLIVRHPHDHLPLSFIDAVLRGSLLILESVASVCLAIISSSSVGMT